MKQTKKTLPYLFHEQITAAENVNDRQMHGQKYCNFPFKRQVGSIFLLLM